MTQFLDQLASSIAQGLVLLLVLGWAGVVFGLALAWIAWVQRSRKAAFIGGILLALAWPLYLPSLHLAKLSLSLPAGDSYGRAFYDQAGPWMLAAVLMGLAWLVALVATFILVSHLPAHQAMTAGDAHTAVKNATAIAPKPAAPRKKSFTTPPSSASGTREDSDNPLARWVFAA